MSPRAPRADGLIDDDDDDDLGPPRLAPGPLLHSGDGDVRQEAVREQVPSLCGLICSSVAR